MFLHSLSADQNDCYKTGRFSFPRKPIVPPSSLAAPAAVPYTAKPTAAPGCVVPLPRCRAAPPVPAGYTLPPDGSSCSPGTLSHMPSGFPLPASVHPQTHRYSPENNPESIPVTHKNMVNIHRFRSPCATLSVPLSVPALPGLIWHMPLSEMHPSVSLQSFYVLSRSPSALLRSVRRSVPPLSPDRLPVPLPPRWISDFLHRSCEGNLPHLPTARSGTDSPPSAEIYPECLPE